MYSNKFLRLQINLRIAAMIVADLKRDNLIIVRLYIG